MWMTRALTRPATPETEAKLLDAAMYSTGAQLERLCRGYRIAMTAENVLPPPGALGTPPRLAWRHGQA
jgi:hypothetical protein